MIIYRTNAAIVIAAPVAPALNGDFLSAKMITSRRLTSPHFQQWRHIANITSRRPAPSGLVVADSCEHGAYYRNFRNSESAITAS